MEKNKLHIAFVIHNAVAVPYFNWFAEKAMNSDEFRFSFIFLNEDNSKVEDEMRDFGADVYHVFFDNSNRKKSMVKSIFKLRKLFKKIKPDIVHSHLFYDGVSSMIAARMSGVKIRIQTKQSTGFNWYYSPWAVKFDRLKNRLATHLITVSNECKEFVIEKEKSKPEKIHLVNHGIKFDSLTQSSEDSKTELIKRFSLENKTVVTTVARYIDWKGYLFIIKAASILIKKYPNLVFLAVGEGPQRKELESYIEELGIAKNFILTGFIERNKIPSLYQISDIYLHAASREPFGFVIAEAMVNSVPVVSTSTGASRDAIEHLVSGFLLKNQEAESIVEGMEFMLNLSKEEIHALRIKTKARALEMFSFDKMWNGYTTIYTKAAKENL